MTELKLHPDRLFPTDETARSIARALYEPIKDLPIVSPHGHTDPAWFAEDAPFSDPATLLITPDHYVFRMLYSQGISLQSLGVMPKSASPSEASDPGDVWRVFANNYHLFSGTPTRMWLDWVFAEVFGLTQQLSAETADYYYDSIAGKLSDSAFRPRALLDKFNIEVIATTEDALDPLTHHQKLRQDGWGNRVITTFRPDNVLDPETQEFASNLERLGKITGEDTSNFSGYLSALKTRRAYFKDLGATATDHGHPSANTVELSDIDAAALFDRIKNGSPEPMEAETFRGLMLMKMAEMSLEDGLVMQLHPGSHRNHNKSVFDVYGRDMGADIPTQTNYVDGLRALLNRFGNEPDFSFIIFTLDESTYSRELAPLAGHYPALKLGPPWWFHDSPEGMARFRERTTETAGFYNTAGFNDDTRAFLSIPARHDVARRMDCTYLSRLVATHQLSIAEAAKIAEDLTYNLVKAAYKL